MKELHPDLKVVFQNEHFIALDKPAGFLSVAGRSKEDKRPCVATLLQESLGQQVWPVHRLDLEVSGLILFALNGPAHRTANGWFARRLVRKRYQAITEGKPAAGWEVGKTFTWTSRILRGKKRAYENRFGDEATVEATWLGTVPIAGQPAGQHWNLHPLTGRGHQLRFELTKQGFPIVGDQLYGSELTWGADGIALRSLALDFTLCPEAPDYQLPTRLEVPPLTATS